MSNLYTLNIKNNSTQSGSFCIFQQLPDVNVPGITTMAWLAKMSHPTTALTFNWSLSYSFVWSNITNLVPGTVVKASQNWDANLTTQNKITFDYLDNAYTFRGLDQGGSGGNLYIDQTKSVQSNAASVGIGMSGKGTFLIPSQPNMKIIMTPKPVYWLIFGDFVEGEILDITEVTKNTLKLPYKSTQTMNVEFGSDNNFNVL
ncbi:MAG: hypothetical protein JKX98_07300 [Alcanivoracaceae bacterium]|nr:hypothetical protein [Alcanivoracaceae bacterium]